MRQIGSEIHPVQNDFEKNNQSLEKGYASGKFKKLHLQCLFERLTHLVPIF